MTRPAVAIFSTTLLPASEGFIRAQAEALSRYQAVYIGCRSVGGLDLPADRTMLVNRSGQRGRLDRAAGGG